MASLGSDKALPENTSQALDAMDKEEDGPVSPSFNDHVLVNRGIACSRRSWRSWLKTLDEEVQSACWISCRGARRRRWPAHQADQGADGVAGRATQLQGSLGQSWDKAKAKLMQRPRDDTTREEIDNLRERDKLLELIKGRSMAATCRNTLTDGGLLPNTPSRNRGAGAEVGVVAKACQR